MTPFFSFYFLIEFIKFGRAEKLAKRYLQPVTKYLGPSEKKSVKNQQTVIK